VHPLSGEVQLKRLIGTFVSFVREGGNGKGTLLVSNRRILSPKNCTALSIDNMSDEIYVTTMEGKLVNLGDDIQDQAINNEQMKHLKNISTCDFVSTRELDRKSVV